MKKQNLCNKVCLGIAALVLVGPSLAFGANSAITVVSGSFNSQTLNIFLNNIYGIVIGITFTLAVLVLVYGGIMYMLSAGDATKAGTAKKIITSGLIGVAIVAGAYLLISLVTWAIGIAASG